MIYQQFSFQENVKIPTVIGVGIIVGVIFFVGRLFSITSIPSRAAKIALTRFEVVNLSQNQVGLVWQTPQPTVGGVIYGEKENALDRIAFDERDVKNTKASYKNHYVILRNLKGNTEYSFRFIADGVLISSSSTSFHFKTPESAVGGIHIKPAYGTVTRSNGLPLEGALVLLSSDETRMLAALTKQTGEWLIPLAMLIDKDLMKPKALSESDRITIEIISEEGEQSLITTTIANLDFLDEPIMIGKNYSFLEERQVLSATDSEVEETNELLSVFYPKEGALIPAKTPLIKGKGIPGSLISVFIDSDTTVAQKVKTNREGLWNVELPFGLSEGSHSLKVIGHDVSGKELILQRVFTIAKAGEQVLGEATKEAALPTATPTLAIIETITPTPPVSGISTNMVMVGSLSIIILGIVLLLVF